MRDVFCRLVVFISERTQWTCFGVFHGASALVGTICSYESRGKTSSKWRPRGRLLYKLVVRYASLPSPLTASGRFSRRILKSFLVSLTWVQCNELGSVTGSFLKIATAVMAFIKLNCCAVSWATRARSYRNPHRRLIFHAWPAIWSNIQHLFMAWLCCVGHESLWKPRQEIRIVFFRNVKLNDVKD